MQKKGIIYGLLSGLFWATTGVLYVYLNNHFPVTTTFNIILLLLFTIELGGGVISVYSVF